MERTLTLAKRYLAWEVVFLFYDAINVLTIGLIGLALSSDRHEQAVFYLVVGALFWSFMSGLFNEVANTITWERWEGTIEYTFMAPIRRFTHLAGMCLFAILYGLARMMIVLLIVALFFRFDLSKANLVAALAVLLAASPAFMGLGLLAAILPLLSPEKGPQATHIIQGVILLVSGVYYPISVLPDWLQTLAYASPGTYALQAMRDALLQGATVAKLWPVLLLLFLSGVVLVPCGLLGFYLAENYALKVGRLKRSG
jgi:ABC-2 type transport system permease protein